MKKTSKVVKNRRNVWMVLLVLFMFLSMNLVISEEEVSDGEGDDTSETTDSSTDNDESEDSSDDTSSDVEESTDESNDGGEDEITDDDTDEDAEETTDEEDGSDSEEEEIDDGLDEGTDDEIIDDKVDDVIDDGNNESNSDLDEEVIDEVVDEEEEEEEPEDEDLDDEVVDDDDEVVDNNLENDNEDSIDYNQINPEDIPYILLNELDGIDFSIETDKKEYSPGEDIWAKINAPNGAVVELSFSYDGFQQYIKIPKEKGYPLDYLLPTPGNLKEGIYTIKSAAYYSGTILKTYTSFKVGKGVDSYVPNALPVVVEEENEVIQTSDDGDFGVEEDTPVVESYEPEEEPTSGVTEKDNVGHDTIKIGEPVKWSKSVDITNYNDGEIDVQLLVDVPSTAENLVVIDADSGSIVSADAYGPDLVISDNLEGNEEKEYLVEFETEAPEKIENEPVETDGEWKKDVIIYSDEEYTGEFEYKNVLSYTNIRESERDSIRLYWNINGEMVDVTDDEELDVILYDTNGNGLVDKVSWITPHLSTQEFQVVITLTTSTGTGLNINLLEPDGESYKQGSGIDFKFVVSYNRSLDVWCNLSVDGQVEESIAVLDGQETIVNKNINFSEGSLDWAVNCKDELNNAVQSSTNSFVVDMSAPTIVLNNNDPDLSLMDNINLSFTATDNLASSLNCDLTLNGAVNSNVAASSGTAEIISLTSLDNGTYQWSVACSDLAGNSNSSSTQTFYIDTNRNFSVIPNKESYSLGEGGIYWVTAPYGAEVTLVITTPKSSTIVRSYTDEFPVIGEIDFTDYPGSYKIEGFMNYNDAIKTSTDYIDVTNTLSAHINVDEDLVTKSSTIKFTASASGGIGDLSYEWDFDDSSATETTKSVTHSYSELGRYTVRLTVTDSKGNEATSTVSIRVEEKYTVDVTVKEAGTNNNIKSARVYLEGEEKITDSSGKVSYSVFKGKQTLFISHDFYHYYHEEFDIKENTLISIELVELGVGEVGTSYETYEEEIIEETSQPQEPEQEEDAETNNIETKTTSLAGELIIKVEDALESLDYMNAGSKEMASTLDLRNEIEKAKNVLKRTERDLFNLKLNRRGLSEEEIEEKKEEIDEEINQIREETIIGVDIIGSDEFVRYPKPKEIEEVSKEFLDSNNISLNKNKWKHYLRSNIEAQSSLTVGTKIRIASVEYLSGERKKIALIVNDLKSGGEVPDMLFVVSIPKEIAESIDEIEVLTEHRVVNPDPIIEFDLAKTEEVIYYIKEDLDLEKLKEIKSVMLFDPDKLEYKGSGLGIIGFAVFSKINEIDDPMIVIEVIVIIILLSVYLIYQYDLIDKFKDGMLSRNEELREIRDFIKDLNVCLENKEVSNATVVYTDVMAAYKKLPKESKSKIHGETAKLYNKIMLAQINESIANTLNHLKNKNIEEAKSNYETIKELYKKLPNDYKAKVGDKCKTVFDKLAAA